MLSVNNMVHLDYTPAHFTPPGTPQRSWSNSSLLCPAYSPSADPGSSDLYGSSFHPSLHYDPDNYERTMYDSPARTPGGTPGEDIPDLPTYNNTSEAYSYHNLAPAQGNMSRELTPNSSLSNDYNREGDLNNLDLSSLSGSPYFSAQPSPLHSALSPAYLPSPLQFLNSPIPSIFRYTPSPHQGPASNGEQPCVNMSDINSSSLSHIRDISPIQLSETIKKTKTGAQTSSSARRAPKKRLRSPPSMLSSGEGEDSSRDDPGRTVKKRRVGRPSAGSSATHGGPLDSTAGLVGHPSESDTIVKRAVRPWDNGDGRLSSSEVPVVRRSGRTSGTFDSRKYTATDNSSGTESEAGDEVFYSTTSGQQIGREPMYQSDGGSSNTEMGDFDYEDSGSDAYLPSDDDEDFVPGTKQEFSSRPSPKKNSSKPKKPVVGAAQTLRTLEAQFKAEEADVKVPLLTLSEATSETDLGGIMTRSRSRTSLSGLLDPTALQVPVLKRGPGRRPTLPAPVAAPDVSKSSRGRKVPAARVNDSDAIPVSGGIMRTSGTRRYMCVADGCGKCFIRGEHLKRHVRSLHTYEKPHPCPYGDCQKSFSRRDNLAQHVKIHLDE